jgi:hypothetical protein
MNAEMRRGVLLVPALTIALLLIGCGGANRRDEVRRNEAILAALPVFPGAVKTHEYSTPEYGNGEFSDPTGYTTTLVYRVPRGTRGAAVIRFYRPRLRRRGWESAVELGTSRRVRRSIADFTRDGARVVVNTIFLTAARRRPVDWIYEIDADHSGGSRR